MTRVEWTSDDFVFASRLDADHQRLFERLEEVRQAVELGTPENPVGLYLWRLSKSLSVHFRSEERLMRRWRYPALQWHHSQHEAGRNKMNRLAEAVRRGDAGSMDNALDEMAGWLKDHVHLADRMLAAFLRNGQRERLVS
jgi:hemerythrin